MTTKANKRVLSLVVALIMTVGMIPATTAYAAVGENFPAACWAYAYTTTPVYQNVSMSGATVGSIGPSEGVTVLSTFSNGTIYLIEYGSTSGPKRGYVYWNQVFVEGDHTAGGVITSSTTVYYWEATNSTVVGSVSTGEIVSVLAKNGSWTYIEYNINTSIGRKRGFIPSSKVSIFSKENDLITYWHTNGNSLYSQQLGNSYTVYGLPRTGTSIGSVSGSEYVTPIAKNININGQTFWFIRYTVSSTGKYKTGYIIHS